MNDNELDRVVRDALAFDAGAPNEQTWRRIHAAIRPSWFPNAREILLAAAVTTAILVPLAVSSRHAGIFPPLALSPRPAAERRNPIISAMHDNAFYTVAAVTRVDGL